MISIKEAENIIRQNLPVRQIKNLGMDQLPGRTLAKNIVAVEPSPRYSNSAMDGYAVRWSDIAKATADKPVSLSLTGESQAGVPFRGVLQPGQAARISTGAMICKGADAVVPQEETEVHDAVVQIKNAKKQHQHIRFEGEEFNSGAPLLNAGNKLGPAEIALLASQGITMVPVFHPAKVSVIVTGSELVAYDRLPKPWEIRDSNSPMLQTAIKLASGAVNNVERVGDDYDATMNALQQGMAESNIVIFSGGVSVGPHDLVKQVAADCGFETLFWRVRQRPGKPLFFARKDGTLLFGLPGNPVSAFMCFQYYINPVIRYLSGETFERPSTQTQLAVPIQNKISRAQLFRVTVDRESKPANPQVYPLEKQGSHMLTSLSDARGFILLDVEADLAAGEMVDVYPLY